MVLQDGFCEKCGERCTDQWCKSCEINELKKNFSKWTSGNKKVDYLIQEMQLKINSYNDIIFEWIPYNQFNDIKEINGDSSYSAIWKDGPLYYCFHKMEYVRKCADQKVILECLYNSQNITNDFFDEV